MKTILTLIALMFPALIWAGERSSGNERVAQFQLAARTLGLADHPEWRALLHWHRDVWGRRRSGVDDQSFFLSPQGRRNLEAELNATLEAFVTSVSTGDASPFCRFPARATWLDQHLRFSELIPIPPCERFENWKEKIAPTSVSLIFASYYFNNPASMYGHTFLKLGRRGYEAGKGLLDYTVNYAAEADTNNGVAFAVKGLTGGFFGRFSTDPYYIKIQKYNNIEARDLWEYDLDFTEAEIELLTEHMWELGPTEIRYFFFNKNCSYQLMPLLDVARPELNLTSEFRYRTIPLDTLQAALRRKNFVSSWSQRPSHVRVLLARRDRLNPDEQRAAKALGVDVSTATLSRLEARPVERQAMVLDSAYDYLRYRVGFYRDRPKAAQAHEETLLSLRKGLPQTVAEPDLVFDNPPPHTAHGTARAGFYAGIDRNESFQEVSVRGSLHDQLDDPTGYVPGSQLEMIHLRGRFYNERKKLSLEQFTIVDVFSLVPYDPWVHPPSWKVWLGADTAHDLKKDPEDSLSYGVKGGSGFTFHAGPSRQALWYVMWRSEFVFGSGFDDNHRIGVGAETGAVLPVHPKFRIHAYAQALRFPTGHIGNVVRYYTAASLNLSRDCELRLIAERQNHHQEARLGLNVYW